MLVAIISAFLGGLILNFMPCVFPIISMKAFGLVRHGDDPGRLRREGTAFFAGTLFAMLALAGTLMGLRAAGEAVGWGFQLQSPIVVAVLALVMVGAALNLCGVFEIGLGLQSAGQAASPAGDGDGVLGAALTGALAVIVAAPCAGPLMAGALGYALVQPPLAGLAVFSALAAGVAAPFTILSFSPALARNLPRPGPWMLTLKHALAFPMLAAAAWLVWVLSRQSGPSGLALILACAVAVGLVSWIYGIAQRRSFSGKPSRGLKGAALAGAAAIAAVIAMPGNFTRATGAAVPFQAATPVLERAAFRPVAWSAARVSAERAAGRPVFVDFSADWCLTCQVNEKAVLATPEFKDAITRNGAVYMVADSTNYDPAIEETMTKLGRTGLPLYLVYPPHGGDPLVLPQLLTRDIAISAIEAATRKEI